MFQARSHTLQTSYGRRIPAQTDLNIEADAYVWPLAGHSISLSLISLIWKVGIVTVLIFPSGHKGRIRTHIQIRLEE